MEPAIKSDPLIFINCDYYTPIPSPKTKEKEILWNAVPVVVVMEEQLLPGKVNDALHSAVLGPTIVTKDIKETMEKDVLVYYWIMQYQIMFGWMINDDRTIIID